MDNIEILEECPLFHNMKCKNIAHALESLHCYSKNYAKGQYVRSMGDAADFIGIVLAGQIQILQDDIYGNRNITASIKSGEIFAEAFVCANVPRIPVDIMAAEACKILFIPKASIFQSNSQCAAILKTNLLEIVAKKNMFLNKKLGIMSQKTTKDKLMVYLLNESKKQGKKEFDIPFDRQALADFLGVERSAMSAEISRLVKAGIIETKKNHFKILV